MKKIIIHAIAFMIVTGMAWAGTIIVTTPVAGDVLCKGRTYTIAWTSSGKIGRVMVRLMSGRTAAANLSLDTANDGCFDFPVDANIPEGGYTIEVQNTSRSVRGESGTFRISACTMTPAPPPPVEVMPTIRVTEPYYRGGYGVGQYVAVEWTSLGRVPEVIDITLHQPDCSTTGIHLASVRTAAGRQVVRIPPTIRPSAAQPVHIRVGQFRSSTSGCVRMDGLQCDNIIMEPNSRSIWHPGETVIVRWNNIAPVAGSNGSVSIYMGSEYGVYHNRPISFQKTLACDVRNTGEARVLVPADLAPGRYTVAMQAGRTGCCWYFGACSDFFQVVAR